MPSLTFVRHEELTEAQKAQLPGFEKDNGISPAGWGEPDIQYGYLEGDTIVAWMWSAVMSDGFVELHVAVDTAHRREQLATRLGLRYFIEENGKLRGYRFVVTSAPLKIVLRNLGFLPVPVQNDKEPEPEGDDSVKLLRDAIQTESAAPETQERDKEEPASCVGGPASTVADDGWERFPFDADELARLHESAVSLQAQAPTLTF